MMKRALAPTLASLLALGACTGTESSTQPPATATTPSPEATAPAPGRSTDAEPEANIPNTDAEPPTDESSTEDAVESRPLAWFTDDYSTDSWKVQSVQSRLTRECMEAAGYNYEAPPSQPPSGYSFQNRYQPLSSAQASEFGYLNPLGEGSEFVEPDYVPSDETEREAFYVALDGPIDQQEDLPLLDPDGEQMGVQTVAPGCWGDANRQIFGSDAEFADYVAVELWLQFIAVESINAALTSPEVLAAITVWTACMDGNELGFETPADASAQPWSEPRPSPDEIAVALTDAECRQESKYDAVLLAADARIQNEIIEPMADDVATASDQFWDFIAQAENL